MSVYYKPTDVDRILNFMGHPVAADTYLPYDIENTEYEKEIVKIKKAQAQDILSIATVIKLWRTVDQGRLNAAGKLVLADKLESVSQKDSKDCFITKLFFRIIGLIKGRGFKTEGEWGLEIARHLRSQQLDLLKVNVTNFLKDPENIEKDLFFNLNALSDKDFKAIIESNIFNYVEGAESHIPAKYFLLYQYTRKMDLFEKLLLERSDWFPQLVDVDGAALVLVEDISEMLVFKAYQSGYVKKFMEDQSSIKAWFDAKLKGGGLRMHEITYFGVLLQFSLRELLKGKFDPSFVEPYKKMLPFINPILSQPELKCLEMHGIKFNKS